MWYKLTFLFSGTWNLRLIEQFLSLFLNKRLYYLRRKVLVVVFRLLPDNGKKKKNPPHFAKCQDVFIKNDSLFFNPLFLPYMLVKAVCVLQQTDSFAEADSYRQIHTVLSPRPLPCQQTYNSLGIKCDGNTCFFLHNCPFLNNDIHLQYHTI